MMDTQSVYNVLECLTNSAGHKGVDESTPPVLYEQALFLQEQGLLEVMPLAEYESASKNLDVFSDLEAKLLESQNIIDASNAEIGLLEGRLGSWMYRLFHRESTVSAARHQLSAVKHRLTLAETVVAALDPVYQELSSRAKALDGFIPTSLFAYRLTDSSVEV